MMNTSNEHPIVLVWTVMMKCANGKSEVIKVVRDYHEADLAVQAHPDLFYKSGPIPIV